jgi:ATP-dependent helicase/nuclease subunit B
VQYGLVAEERLLGGLKATDTGTILHDVLCNYFEDKSKKNADYSAITRDECVKEISALVDKYAGKKKNEIYTGSNYLSYILMRLRSIASGTAWKMVRFYAQSKFRPTGFEIGFGPDRTLPPYPIETENGTMELNGYIDRVDSANINGQDYIAICDYKSSEKKIDPLFVDAGITIQPLIYANAVAKSTEGTKPAAMMYLQMNDPLVSMDHSPEEEVLEKAVDDEIKVHGLFLNEPAVIAAFDPDPDNKKAAHFVNCNKNSRLIGELFERKLQEAEKTAAKTADSIASGNIAPQPPDLPGFDPCQWCPYTSICKSED